MTDMEKTLEFDKIKEKLAELAHTDKAKKEIWELKPYLVETELEARLRETTEGRMMLEKCGNPPAASLHGIDEWMEIARMGGCLVPEQLEEITAALTAVRRWKDYLVNGKRYEIGLAWYEGNLDALDEIREELQTKIRNGEVDDYASGTLKSLREKIIRTDEKMHEKVDSVMRTNKQYMADSFSTVKNGHLCVPVKKEYRGRINGSIIDKSSAGSTLFMEPAAAARLYEELQELRIEEENEVRIILYSLTVMLSDKEEIIMKNNRTIVKMDFIFAKARFSLEQGGVRPKINTQRYIRLINGRHPLMERAKNVPLNFEIGHGVNGVVITGPNTGGKTVAIKTVALNCLMAQCGLHVPCEEAEICMNNAVLCDIGDGQNLSENLSTFSAHITNVLEILKTVSNESLVIMDELGSGTDPAEGMGIAIAVLEELKKSGALFLVTTHYPEVKEYAAGQESIVNARMTFDRESLRPLYRLVIGEAGESCAFYIAGRLGMPENMLKNAASAAYGNFYGTAGKSSGTINAVTCGGEAEGIPDRMEMEERLEKKTHPKIQKKKSISAAGQEDALRYHLGDSVMVLPEKKIGIICRTADEKGMLKVQLRGEKRLISHKRLRLHVAAKELYPEDYDFSIIFDSVEKRKARHDMERKYVKDIFISED